MVLPGFAVKHLSQKAYLKEIRSNKINVKMNKIVAFSFPATQSSINGTFGAF
jgi:hexokinase